MLNISLERELLASSLLPHSHIQMVRAPRLHVGNLIVGLDTRSFGSVSACTYINLISSLPFT